MRKSLCVVLLLLLCSWATFVFAEEQTNDLHSQQQDIQNQLDEANHELSDVQSELSDNLQQVQKLDEKVESTETKLEELTKEVNELKTSIEDVEKNLQEETEKYEKQKTLLEERMVAIYEAGETQYLDIVLHSKSVSEFLSSYYVISEIAESDTELLNSIGKRKKEITLFKEQLENQRTQFATIVENQTRTAKILQNTKVVRENYIAKLSQEEKDKQREIDEYNEALRIVNTQILELARQGIDTEYIGGVLAWPVPGYTRINSYYGMRVHPITHVYKLHTGIDIDAPMGANFVAANDGIVVKAEFNSAYGKMVVIDHGGGISTLYAHGLDFTVEVGQSVKRNETVLKVGSTGYSTGPHAHFEVRKNGVVTNPLPYITNGIVPNSEEDSGENTNMTNEAQ